MTSEDDGERHSTIVGMVEGTLLFVAFTERVMVEAGIERERIRIISARRATKHEQDDDDHQNNQAP